MVEEVGEVNALFEVISATIGHDAPVCDMKLADGPRIESRLCEEGFEDRLAPDLNVPAPEAKTTHAKLSRHRAEVLMMKHPALGGDVTIDAWNRYQCQIRRSTLHAGPHFKRVSVWTANGTNAVHEYMKVSRTHEPPEKGADLIAEPKRSGKRDWRYLGEIGTDRCVV
jgi:hypothetical protein